MTDPRGLLLINLGTPEGPTPKQVRAYLGEFLMDPLVIDIPAPLRWMLLHLAILPRRPATSAAAYQKIWTNRGSPLLFHLEDLATSVQKILGQQWIVKGGMRYGRPSIQEALKEIKAHDDLKDIPIVVFTTSKAEEDIYRSYKLGVNSFITKPVTFENLIDVMQMLGKYWFEIVTLPSEEKKRTYADASNENPAH